MLYQCDGDNAHQGENLKNDETAVAKKFRF